jgi:hypothetical protein
MPPSEENLCDELQHIFNYFLKKHMKMLLGHFNPKVSRKNISKPNVGNESLH